MIVFIWWLGQKVCGSLRLEKLWRFFVSPLRYSRFTSNTSRYLPTSLPISLLPTITHHTIIAKKKNTRVTLASRAVCWSKYNCAVILFCCSTERSLSAEPFPSHQIRMVTINTYLVTTILPFFFSPGTHLPGEMALELGTMHVKLRWQARAALGREQVTLKSMCIMPLPYNSYIFREILQLHSALSST